MEMHCHEEFYGQDYQVGMYVSNWKCKFVKSLVIICGRSILEIHLSLLKLIGSDLLFTGSNHSQSLFIFVQVYDIFFLP